MRIYVRKKDGNYQAIISYKQNGKWTQKSKQGFKTKKEANNWAEENIIKLSQFDNNNMDSTLTVKQALSIYLEYKKSSVKFTTYKNIKSNIAKLNSIYDMKITAIKPIDISMFFSDIRIKNNKTYNTLMDITKNFFTFCINHIQIIQKNPVVINKIKSTDKRIKYIEYEMYQEILNSCRDYEKRLMINILYYTGMRYNEVLGLKYKDIDKNKNIITISRQICLGQISTLKTKNSYRQIPILKNLQNILYKEIENKKQEEYIFRNNIKITYQLKKYNTSAHCFRHTFATNLVAKGINLKVASEIIGDTFDTFVNTYVQPSKKEREQTFKQLIENT